MIEKFMQNGCAPPLKPKWKIITDQLSAEMALVMELDQCKTNFSTGMSSAAMGRGLTSLERMDV